MALCPKCKKHFRVMEDEDPRDFGCPYCGYGEPPEIDYPEDENEDE